MTSGEQDNAHALATLLKVIADESRLRILGLLAEGPLVGKEIAARLDLTPPTVSHHMRKLVDAGIVTATSDAQMQRYALNSDLLLDMRRAPLAQTPQEEPVGEQDADAAYRAKVLRKFFDGERLKSIPAQRKQRVIVLQKLMERFDPSRTYPEREVNDLLRPAHDDVASLRREMVDYGFMTRERGVYQVARSTPFRSKQVAQEITGDERAWLGALIRSTVGSPERRQ
jgi:biotin operon repressor